MMLNDLEYKSHIIKNFLPSWFASVMGTGVLALVSLFYSKYLFVLKDFAYELFYFNVALFFILLILWILRWVFFREDALKDLNNPIISNFYPTIAVGMLVLSADFIFIAKDFFMGEIFWFAGALSTMFFAVLILFIMFKGSHVKIDHINPAWFIPPVGLVVVPIAGSSLISHFSGIFKEFVIILNYICWGSGFFIYLALLAICINRFILRKPLPNTLAPTIWINLGPIGASTTSLINLIKNSAFVKIKEPFFVSGLFFWGFGIWWTIMAIIMTLYYIKKLKLPFTMSWWAFTFPLGAYVAATHSVSLLFKISIIDYIGFGLYWLLLLLWLLTLIYTVIRSYHGTLFKR